MRHCVMHAGRSSWFIAILVLCLLTGACVRPDNLPITDAGAVLSGKYPARYDFDAWVTAHGGVPDPAVVLSFSGGGLKAAALATAVLSELSRYRLPSGESLADHVAIVASNSGGGFAAANFVVNGPDSLDKFRDGFLRSSLLSSLLIRAASDPFSLYRIFEDRSGYLRDGVDALLEKTAFGQLDGRRPFLLIGATDYSAERHFVFSQRSFSDLCSDLSRFSVAEAVTASAAVPFGLTDVELTNYSGLPECPLKGTLPKPDPAVLYSDKQRFLDWRYSDSLRRSHDPPTDPSHEPFRRVDDVHLFDGGIVDNLAIRPLLRLLDQEGLKTYFADRTILFVLVNARSDTASDIDHNPGSPYWSDLIEGVPFGAIDNDTALSDYTAFAYWNEVFATAAPGPFAARLYFAEVDFDQMLDPVLQKTLKEMGSLSLTAGDLDNLYAGARLLLEAHPCFAAFVKDAKVARPGAQGRVDPMLPEGCAVLKPGKIAKPPLPPLFRFSNPESR
jgi:NTE family protein